MNALPRAHRSTSPGRSTERRGRRLGWLIVAAFAGLGAMSSSALALEITMFPERDFVEVGGLAAGDVVNVDVLRGGQVVGRAHNIAAFEEVPATGFVVLVNHPGGPDKCWEIATPDLQPGDVIRATVVSGPTAPTVDEASIANVTVTQPATIVGSDIVVRGTAQTPGGQQIPIGEIEQRLIHAPGGAFESTNGRRLAAPGEGVLTYDSPTGTAWTAIYRGRSADDRQEAVEAESRILHLAKPNGAEFDAITIFEFGVTPGPGLPQCPPLEVGPTVDLAAASDTGASSSDDVTNANRPTISGARGSFTAQSTVNVYDTFAGTTTLIGSTTMAADGSFSVVPADPLADGVHQLRAGHAITGPEVLGRPLAITIDTTAPPTPTLSGTVPTGPANDNAPFVRGQSESGATVTVYPNAMCSPPSLATGPAAAFASPGLQFAVSDDSQTTVAATATDLAGNVSPCSAPATYLEVSPKPLAALTTGTVTVKRAKWRVGLVVRCAGPPGSVCRGRVTLAVKVRTKAGKRVDLVLGGANYTVASGTKRTIQVTLKGRARTLLAKRTSLRVQARLVAATGTGVAATTRTVITLRVPKV